LNSDQHSGSSAIQSQRSGRIAAVLLLVFAAGLAVLTSQIKFSFASDPLGPRSFPYLLAFGLAVCAVWYWFTPGSVDTKPEAHVLRKLLALIALSCITMGVMPWLGFITSMAMLCAGLARLFGANWTQALVSGVLQAVGWWAIFALLMGGVLPVGPLGF
jgi:putative tricarboxylic transport membrane protein